MSNDEDLDVMENDSDENESFEDFYIDILKLKWKRDNQKQRNNY